MSLRLPSAAAGALLLVTGLAAAPAAAGTVSFEGVYAFDGSIILEPCFSDDPFCGVIPLEDDGLFPVPTATVSFTVDDSLLVSGGDRPVPRSAGVPGVLAFEFVLSGGGPSDGTYTLEDLTDFIFSADGSIDLSQDLVGQRGFFDFNFFTAGPVNGIGPNSLGVGFLDESIAIEGPSPFALSLEPYFLTLDSLRVTDINASTVPVPAAGLLLAPAALGLFALGRRRRRTA